MAIKNRRLTPLSDSEVVELRSSLVDYWNAIAVNDLARTLGNLVFETQVRVTELLERGDSWDVYEASRLTVEFEFIRNMQS